MSETDQPIALESPKLKRVLAHWREARGNHLMPAWRDILPAKIKTELSIVWSYRYDEIHDDFVGGLAGEEIRRLLGGPIKNVSFRCVHDGEDLHFFARAKRVLSMPSIFAGRGLLFRQRERQCYGERIILPFFGSDGQPGGILGATDFKAALQYGAGLEMDGEAEQWENL